MEVNEETGVLQIENYGTEPVRLNLVQVRR
jgi:hypothetical protein